MEAVAAINLDEPTVDRIRSYIRSDQVPIQELRTAIVVSGADKSAFSDCLDRIRGSEEGELVVRLRANQAPSLQAGLKALIRNTIEAHLDARTYDTFVAKHKRQTPMNFDLELLQKYVEANSITRIVVAMPDAETFDLNVFSELVANLLSWKDRLPFVLALGLATTVHLFESRLSKATMRRLNADVFALSSERDVFFDLIEAVQNAPIEELDASEPCPVLGPSLISALAALAEEQTTTIQSFKKAIQFAYMTHFFSNALSVILDADIFESDEIDSSLCEAIRSTPSFQAHCGAILNGKVQDTVAATVREIISTDSALLRHVQQHISPAYTNVSARNSTFLVVARVAAELSPKASAIKLYHDLITSDAQSKPLDSDAYSIIESTLPILTTTAFTAVVSKLPDTSYPSSATTSPSALHAHITNLLTMPATPSMEPLFLSEALLLTSRSPLVSAFNPKPRFAIERALLTPADYLGCECCTNNMHSTEPTVVLYRLLGEAGREVNVMDLWTTFRARVMNEGMEGTKSVNGKGKGKGKGNAPKGKENNKTQNGTVPAKGKRKSRAADDAAGPDTELADTNGHAEHAVNGDADSETMEPERRVLAQFYSALAELRYLGLVKSASDRRLNKGVEVISRLTWHGL